MIDILCEKKKQVNEVFGRANGCHSLKSNLIKESAKLILNGIGLALFF